MAMSLQKWRNKDDDDTHTHTHTLQIQDGFSGSHKSEEAEIFSVHGHKIYSRADNWI